MLISPHVGRTMVQEIELELVSGGHAKLTLPEPGEFASFYVFSMESSGNVQFWQLLVRLMAAAGRPVCAFHEGMRHQLANQGNVTRSATQFDILHFESDMVLNQGNVTRSAMQHLLRRRGYGFGIFF